MLKQSNPGTVLMFIGQKYSIPDPKRLGCSMKCKWKENIHQTLKVRHFTIKWKYQLKLSLMAVTHLKKKVQQGHQKLGQVSVTKIKYCN